MALLQSVLKLSILSILSVLLCGCITLESISLDDCEGLTCGDEEAYHTKVLLFCKHNASLSSWFSCTKDRPGLTLDDGNLNVSVKEARGDCFGIYFSPRNIAQTPVVKVRARYNASSKVTSIDMLAGLTDDAKGKTYTPEKAKMVKAGSDFVDYYFDYSDVIEQKESYINHQKIKTILIYLNILGVSDVSGNLIIEEISLHSKNR